MRIMNKSEFKKLELHFRQRGLSLKSYLKEVGVNYANYNYWHKKCSSEKDRVPMDLAPISLNNHLRS